MARKMGIEELVNLAVTPNRTDEETLAITLEICDWVNSQKRDGPLKATEILLQKINSRNEKIALPALSILDACVKNCGFPFHLQIASKKFLNELVRTFPEKPPAPLNPILVKILELLATWRSELCEKSRYKNDLILINEMCKLLKSKGYRFPKIQSTVAIVNEAALQTEEELLEQDKKAQAAKLDELLRRGTPTDLAAANELMKVMASYDFEKKDDLKKEVEKQLQKLESDSKDALIILDTMRAGDDPTAHFKLQDLLSAIKTSRPKIQKSLEEEVDEQKMESLLKLNDIMNTVFENYESLKTIHANGAANRESESRIRLSSTAAQYTPQGAAPSRPPQATTSSIPTFQPQKKPEPPSLIDLDFDAFPSQPPAAQQPPAAFPKLAALSISGGFQDQSASQPPFQQFAFPPSQGFQQSAFQPSLDQQQFFPATFPPMQAAQPAPAMQTVPPMQSEQPVPAFQPNPPVQPTQPAQAPAPVIPLISPPPAISSPTSQTPTHATHGMSALYYNQSKEPVSTPVVLMNKNGLEITGQFEKVPEGAENVRIHCKILNHLPMPMTDVVIQLAVPKSMKLRLEPLSSTSVAPVKMGGPPVTQRINLENPTSAPIRIRFKINYKLAGQDVEEQGEYTNVPQL